MSGGQEGKLSELFRAVLCMTVVHSDMHTHYYEQFIQVSVGLGLGLVFVHLFVFSILCVFCGLVDYFVLVLFSFVVLDLSPSVLYQEIGWNEISKRTFLCHMGCKILTQLINHWFFPRGCTLHKCGTSVE